MSQKVVCPSCSKNCSVLTIGFGVAEHRTIKCLHCKKESTAVTILTDDVHKIEEHIQKLMLKAHGFQRDKIIEVITDLRKKVYKSIPKNGILQRRNALLELQEIKNLSKEVWDEC